MNNPLKQFVPDDLHVSKLRFYSIGIVAQNKPINTDMIDVTPTEELNMLDGELTAHTENISVTGVNHDGQAYSGNVNSNNVIRAKWLPINSSNRKTSPDVRRGESVIIYQFGDSTNYFWSTLKDDSNLRKLETVIYSFSATTKEDTEQSASNTYYLEISTHKKCCTFHTSKDNGEPFAYTVQINTKDGIFIITDDVGNYYYLNSKERILEMRNIDDTSVKIDKTSILNTSNKDIINKTKSFIIKASKEVIIDTPDIESSGNFTGQGNSVINGKMTITDLTASGILTAINFVKSDGGVID